MAYILQGVRFGGLGDDAKKAQLKAAKDAMLAKGGTTTGSGSGSGSTSKDEDDGKIFGLPPVVVAAGAAIAGYFGVRFIQRKRAR